MDLYFFGGGGGVSGSGKVVERTGGWFVDTGFRGVGS